MLLNLSEANKKHLMFFNDASDDVLSEFCRISIEFVTNGVNPKLFSAAAKKLGVSKDDVRNGVQSLMNLFLESSKVMISDVDFHDSMLMLAFSESHCQQLLQSYTQNRHQIRAMLSAMKFSIPRYFTLEWRFDIVLASRTLRHQVSPVILLKFHFQKDNESVTTLLQTDPVNLLHITKILEEALNEMKSASSRRMLRYL